MLLSHTYEHNAARTGANKLTHKLTHTDKYTLNTLKAWQAKPPVGLGFLLSSTEQNSQGSRLEEGTQCVSTPSPAKVSVSGDGSSQQLARLELSVCWLQAAGCLVLPGIYNSTQRNFFFPPLSPIKAGIHFFNIYILKDSVTWAFKVIKNFGRYQSTSVESEHSADSLCGWKNWFDRNTNFPCWSIANCLDRADLWRKLSYNKLW